MQTIFLRNRYFYIKLSYSVEKNFLFCYTEYVKTERTSYMILVIHTTNYKAQRFAESIKSRGFLAVGAAAKDALKELGPRYRAIIVLEPIQIEYMHTLVDTLNTSVFATPIFTVGEPSLKINSELKFSHDTSAKDVVKKIAAYLNFYGFLSVGNYRAGGFDASVYSKDTTFLDEKIPLTKTECMILRYIIKSYPVPQPIKEILRAVFPHSKPPQPSDVRAHISNMNEKFCHYIGRQKIKFVKDVGYVLITPENAKIN